MHGLAGCNNWGASKFLFAPETTGRDFTLGLQALQRVAQPHDIADAIGFLASDAASYITGQALNVCGGLEMD